jgi:predicted nuclease with TOPRIM domain
MEKNKTKAQLIEENQELRVEIENMQKTIKKLENKAIQLEKAHAHGRRGMPWGS